MKSETDDGLPSCSNFPERPSSYELESDKPVLPEIEHLRGKIGEQSGRTGSLDELPGGGELRRLRPIHLGL